NYKPLNGLASLDTLERHLATDESFIHVGGVSCLLIKDLNGSFRAAMMKPGAVYTVPRDVWHTTVTKPGVKIVIVERSGTNMENSELLKLDEEARKQAVEAILATGFGQFD
ncbi:MAG: cupin, partial [Spirochaetota bacterium]